MQLILNNRKLIECGGEIYRLSVVEHLLDL